jgi:hypothetical protein
MWMMLALFAGLGGLLAAGLFVASRAVRSMGLSAASARDTIRTPGGAFRLQKETEIGPGLPVYPRASLVVPDEQTAAAAIKQAQEGMEVSTYQSSETRDFVDGWYMKHLSAEFTRHEPNSKLEGAVYIDAHVLDSDIVFVAERENKMRVVALSENPSGTKILLIRFDKAPAGTAPTVDPGATPSAASTPEQTSAPASAPQ